MAQPQGADYAARLTSLLDTLGIERCVLVGHSLGALMAAPAASRDDRIAALVLISPAQGYGAAGREADRARVRSERLATLEKLGELKSKGILTQEEFDAKKAELLKKLV